MQQFADAQNGHLAARNERIPQVCARIGVVEGQRMCECLLYLYCVRERVKIILV
jgi:hypothetical protein